MPLRGKATGEPCVSHVRRGGVMSPGGWWCRGQSSVEYALVVMALAAMVGALACLWHAGRDGTLLSLAVRASSHQLGGGDPVGSLKDLSLY